ncbi:MAG: hypothetical protein KJ621_09880 [Proteobacteria bacterium]|nr:hypothetical protein [Pseudomonadota bacterium]MBU1740143.1 hypothetical protein [Pseudomonadota bacterium]
MSREEELVAQGWTRQTVMNEPRLSEVVEEYQSLGFEVRLEPIDPGRCNEQGCDACFQGEGVADRFRVVYTRPGGGPWGVDDLL